MRVGAICLVIAVMILTISLAGPICVSAETGELDIPDIIMEEDSVHTLNLMDNTVDVDNTTWRVVGDLNLTLDLNETTWILNITPASSWHGMSWIDIHMNDTVREIRQRINVTVEPLLESVDENIWEITHVDLNVDTEGDWEMDIYGSRNMTLYIVIEDIGSYQIDESRNLPGNYSLDLDSEIFKAGQDYGYYFTNVSDGPDLDPSVAGTISQPGSEDDEREFPWPAILASLIVLIIIIVVFILGMKGKKDGEFQD